MKALEFLLFISCIVFSFYLMHLSGDLFNGKSFLSGFASSLGIVFWALFLGINKRG